MVKMKSWSELTKTAGNFVGPKDSPWLFLKNYYRKITQFFLDSFHTQVWSFCEHWPYHLMLILVKSSWIKKDLNDITAAGFRCHFLSYQLQKRNTKNGAVVTSLRPFLFCDDFSIFLNSFVLKTLCNITTEKCVTKVSIIRYICRQTSIYLTKGMKNYEW